MKALRFDRTGSLGDLQWAESKGPEPAKGEILVEVRAAGLNPSDFKNVLGRFSFTTLPRTPGRDFAGVVVAGDATLAGKEVWGTGCELGFFRDGSHAEYLVVPADGVARKPACLTFEIAAACGVPYTTAWDALERSRVGEGTRLVVIGAAGAVGTAAVALARFRGANVVGAVRRPEQRSPLEKRGVSTIALPAPDAWPEAVRAHFPEGADVVFDTTGFWLPASVGALAQFGRIAVIAPPDGGHAAIHVQDLYRRGGSIIGINSLLYDTRACAKMLTRFADGFERGQLDLPADPLVRPFAAALDAYRALAAGASEKVVFSMGRIGDTTIAR